MKFIETFKWKTVHSSVYILITFLLISFEAKSQIPSLDWAVRMGGTDLDEGNAITTDALGNVFIAGRFAGSADFDPGPSTFNLVAGTNPDIFIMKLDASGNFVWAKSMGAIQDDRGLAIALDPSGNVYTTGYFQGTVDFDPGVGTFNLTSLGSFDIFVSKLDAAGNLVWAKAIGSTDGDIGQSIATDAIGNVYVSGFFSGTTDFDPSAGVFSITPIGPGTDDVFVLKLNTSGNFIWAKSIGGNDNGDDGRSIKVDASSNLYITGNYQLTADFDPGIGVFNLTAAGGEDIFVSKLDTNGNFIWAKSVGGTGDDEGLSLAVDASGNITTTGSFELTSDFDPGAGTANVTAVGSRDCFVFKLDASGNFVWAKGMGGSDIDRGNSIAMDGTGNSYTTGYFGSTVDFDPATATTFDLTSNGSLDVFISKLDPSGNFVWAVQTGGIGLDLANAISIGASKIHTTGYFSKTVDFDPGTSVFNLIEVGGTNIDVFVQKLNTSVNLPTISSFNPTSGPTGTTVTITGINFDAVPTNNAVKFSGTSATATSSSTTNIITTVPTGATTGTITVTVAGNTATSATNFTVTSPLIPTITSFAPASGPIGTTVIITGTNFDAVPANNTVKFNGISATATSSSTTSITTTVPTGATTGPISVTVAGNTATSASNFTVTPVATIAITTQPSASTVCNGTAATFTAAATGTTNITYQWQFSTTLAGTYADISNASGYSNVTAATLSVNTTGNFGAGFYRCKVSGDFAATVFTNGAQLTINAIPAAPSTTGASACAGASTTLTASGGANGQYRWYTVSTGGTAIAGETNSTYTTPSLNITTSYYVSIVNGTCESPRTQVTVTIGGAACNNQPPVINTTFISAVADGIVTINLLPLISDVDNNLDLNSLKIKQAPISNALTSISQGVLTINYAGTNFSGTDNLTIEVCDLKGSCTQQQLTIEVTGDIIVYNGISPNGDIFNATWQIKNIELLQETKNNKVTLYNRWGDEVFSATNYDNKNKVFKGISNNGSELSSGTYFYKIEFESGRNAKAGYLILKK
ncbi:MAG: IPT/TIG domain-containing protein [Cyclobacteriaceae bacterium]